MTYAVEGGLVGDEVDIILEFEASGKRPDALLPSDPSAIGECPARRRSARFTASVARSPSTTAGRGGSRPWTSSMPGSSGRATCVSTSAPTSAIGSARRRTLGARVVAVEPQPALVLRPDAAARPDRAVSVDAAVAEREGHVAPAPQPGQPDDLDLSPGCSSNAQAAPSFRGQLWPEEIVVSAITIDALIAAHGLPRFVKIDVEGYEAEALRGLSQPVFALSVEFVPMDRAAAEASLDRLMELGAYRFNASRWATRCGCCTARSAIPSEDATLARRSGSGWTGRRPLRLPGFDSFAANSIRLPGTAAEPNAARRPQGHQRNRSDRRVGDANQTKAPQDGRQHQGRRSMVAPAAADAGWARTAAEGEIGRSAAAARSFRRSIAPG